MHTQVEKIRKENSRNKIRVHELIFITDCESSKLMQHISRLPQLTNMLKNNTKLKIIYASDVGDPIDKIQEKETPSLSTIVIDDLYKAISGLMFTYYKISKEGILHRNITCNSVTYKRDNKNEFLFYFTDFDLSFNDWSRIDEANLNIHRNVVKKLSLLVPIEQYFFTILLYVWLDSVLNCDITHVKSSGLSDRFQRDGGSENLECLVKLKRGYFDDLLKRIELYFKKIYDRPQMSQKWQRCHDIIYTLLTDKMKTKIIAEAKIKNASNYNTNWSNFKVYDEMYTEFSIQFYTMYHNEQKRHIDTVGICFDRHSLGVLIRVLLECKTQVDTPSYDKSIELAFDLMFSRKKLSQICKEFDKMVYVWSTRPNATHSNNTELNICSICANVIDKALLLVYDVTSQNIKLITRQNAVPAIYPRMLPQQSTQIMHKGTSVPIIQRQVPYQQPNGIQLFQGNIMGQPMFRQQTGQIIQGHVPYQQPNGANITMFPVSHNEHWPKHH